MNTKKILQIAVIVTVLSVLTALILHITNDSMNTVAPYKFRKAAEPDYEGALKTLKAKVSQFPDSVIELNGLATLYIQLAHETGDHSLVLEAEKAAKRSWHLRKYFNTTALLLLAEVEESRHSFHQSLKISRKVLSEQPSSLGAYTVLVTSNLGLGRNQEALEAAKALITRKPSLGNFILVGLAHEAIGNRHESRDAYETGMSLEDLGETGSSAWVRTLLGRSHFEEGNYPLARAYYQSALKISPRYHLALNLLAKLEVEEKHYDIADRFYTEAFQHSGEPPYLIEHAKLKKLMGDTSSAYRMLEQAEKTVREELVATPFGHPAELIEVLLEKGGRENIEEAVQWAKREVKARENYSKAHQQLKRALNLRNSL